MDLNARPTQRVLMLGWSEASALGGGVGVVCGKLAEELRSYGLDVLTVKGDKVLARVDGAICEEVGMVTEVVPGPYLTGKGFAIAMERLGGCVSEFDSGGSVLAPQKAVDLYSREVRVTMERHGFIPDGIHAHDWLAFAAGEPIGKSCNAPVVLHVHSTEFERVPGGADGDIVDFEAAALAQADAIVTVSERTSAILVERYGVSPERVEVVAPGDRAATETSSSLPRFAEFTVLFLGRVTPQKGPFFFLEVAERLLAEDSNWRFVIAGDGESLPEMIERSAAIGIANRVHFCGFVSEVERDDLFGLADVLFAPSASEPFGLAVMEAVVAGIPVVVSRQSGVAEWLADSLSVDYWDMEKACEKLRLFRSDPDEAAAAVAVAQSSTRELTRERSRDRILDCYARAVAQGRS